MENIQANKICPLLLQAGQPGECIGERCAFSLAETTIDGPCAHCMLVDIAGGLREIAGNM